jgi:hypothetical protein
VQTAVIGDAESEVPISLPREAIEVDRFRSVYAEATFWCGHWLGGCGTQLTTKLYLDRACHFAHFPHHPPESAPSCQRAAGVEGADHLYVKAALLGWLGDQDITAQARIPRDPDGTVHSGTVLVEPGDRAPLRVVLHKDAAAAGAPDAEALLGLTVAHDPWLLTLPGYVHRIRCHSEGTTRRVMIGTQQRRGTDWFDLDDCSLEEQGLTTPAIAELRRQRAGTRLLGQPRPRRSAPAPAPTAPAPVVVDLDERRPAAFAAQEAALIDGSTPTDLRRLAKQAQATLPANNPSRDEIALLQEATVQCALGAADGRTGRALIPSDGVQRLTLLHVINLVDQLRKVRYERRPLIRTLVDEAESVRDWLQPRLNAEINRLRQEVGDLRAPAPAPAAPPVPPPRRYFVPVVKPPLDDIAGALRDVLTHTARLGTTVKWTQACRQVTGLKGLERQDLRQVLDDAGKASVRDPLVPHLAVLISNDQGGPLKGVVNLLRGQYGRFRSPDRDQVREAWLAEVNAVHARYQPRP